MCVENRLNAGLMIVLHRQWRQKCLHCPSNCLKCPLKCSNTCRCIHVQLPDPKFTAGPKLFSGLGKKKIIIAL